MIDVVISGVVVGGGAALTLATSLAFAMRRSLLAAYADVRADLARATEENRADRQRWRSERESYRRELQASTAGHAECRAEVQALKGEVASLRATIDAKLLAAQPRDEHGRFEAEQG